MNIDGTLGNKFQLPMSTRPYDFGTDAIERQRVSLGQAMMDADFEYGLQATKWQSFFDVRKTPTFFDIPGTDAIVSNVASDGAAPYSNITVYYNNAYSLPQVTGQPISLFGLKNPTNTADRAEGYYIVFSNVGASSTALANTANYVSKGFIPSGNIQTNLTFMRRGGIYNNATANVPFIKGTSQANDSNIQFWTSNSHGIMAGTPMTLQTTFLGANGPTLTANGVFLVSSITSSNTFNISANTMTFTAVGSISNTTTQIYVNPFGSTQHRPYDGGVLLSTLSPAHGSTVLRQSKKAFRYQSGKGILFSSGTLFSPNLDIASVSLFGPTTTVTGGGSVVASNLVVPVNSVSGFATGQIVATTVSSSQGTVSITGINPSTPSMNLAFTGTPASSLTVGTVITTLPAGQSNIQLVTDIAHGLPATGANVILRNFGTSNINGKGYYISGCIDSRTVNVVSQNLLTSTLVNLGDQPRMDIVSWHGATVRAGIFDDANGMFWEYDGANLYVVRRQSTYQCCGFAYTSPYSQVLIGSNTGTTGTGTVSSPPTPAIGDTSAIIKFSGAITILANMYTYVNGLGYVWVIGNPNYNQIIVGFQPNTTNFGSTPFTNGNMGAFVLPSTRFQDQFRVNDRFIIRGMCHQVTSIQGQGIITFNPPYRGSVPISKDTPVKICKVKELRIPQSAFNRDTMDGQGASGFKFDPSRMQMIGIQYTWYGAGFIDYMMRGPDGNWLYAHRIRNNNVNDEAYMRSGNLPVRYELTVENRNAVSSLTNDLGITSSSTDTIATTDPTTYFPVSGTLLVDNELINYSNNTGQGFTGITRGYALNYVINDTSRTFTGQVASNHLTGTSVNLVSCSATPTLTHWGSSFLTDGQFDTERGYYFNYSNTSVIIGSGTSTVTVPILGTLAVAAASPATWQVGDVLTFASGVLPPGTLTVGSVNAAGPYITVNFNPSYVISVQLPLFGWIASHVVTISGAGTTVPPSPTLLTVSITGSGGQFSCTSASLSVNQALTISGTYGGTGSISGYSNPTTYYIIATNGTTTFTLSATLGGTAITTTIGTPTGLTYTLVLSVSSATASTGDLTIAWAGSQAYNFPIGTVITNASASSSINQKVIVAAAVSGTSTSVALSIQAVGAGSGATATFLATHAVTNFLTVTGASVASSAPGTVTLTVTGVTPATIASGTSIVDTSSGATLLTNGTTSLTSTTPQNITVSTKVTNSTRSTVTAIATVLSQVNSGASSGFALYLNPITSNFAVGDVVTTAGGTATISSISINPPQLVLSPTGSIGTIQQYNVINDITNSLSAYASAVGTVGLTNSACAFAIRLAPSITNGLTGDIGVKELLNRAQLLLQKLEVTAPFNVQTVGFLNPTGVSFNSANWVNVNTQQNGTQPSFVQYYPGNLITGTPQPGERIFSTIVQGNNQNNLDLSALKEMSNSVIGGNQNFPDGPDVLVIYLTNLTQTAGTVQVNLFWSEAQA